MYIEFDYYGETYRAFSGVTTNKDVHVLQPINASDHVFLEKSNGYIFEPVDVEEVAFSLQGDNSDILYLNFDCGIVLVSADTNQTDDNNEPMEVSYEKADAIGLYDERGFLRWIYGFRSEGELPQHEQEADMLQLAVLSVFCVAQKAKDQGVAKLSIQDLKKRAGHIEYVSLYAAVSAAVLNDHLAATGVRGDSEPLFSITPLGRSYVRDNRGMIDVTKAREKHGIKDDTEIAALHDMLDGFCHKHDVVSAERVEVSSGTQEIWLQEYVVDGAQPFYVAEYPDTGKIRVYLPIDQDTQILRLEQFIRSHIEDL